MDPAIVIIAEDEADFLDILHYWLLNQGFELVVCHNGNEALDKLQELKRQGISPLALITDINMPGMTGNELIEIVAADLFFEGMHIAVMTAYHKNDPAVQQIAGNHPDIRIWHKPFPANQLAAEIIQQLNNRPKGPEHLQ